MPRKSGTSIVFFVPGSIWSLVVYEVIGTPIERLSYSVFVLLV